MKEDGLWGRGVDIKEPEFEETSADESLLRDLREESARSAVESVSEVYHLAADMGGIGYITGTHAPIARNNTRMDLHMLDAACDRGMDRFLLYISSACVYPQYLQEDPDVDPLGEEDAWPADPEPGYGLEKLYMEKLCQYYREDFGLETRVLRFHKVYGPKGAWEGGKEKAPAALCRKVAEAGDGGSVVGWATGSRPARSCTSATACRASTGSCSRTTLWDGPAGDYR